MDPDFHVSSATISYSFRNFSQINKLTSSPACWIQNLPWKIFIEPVIQDGKKYLSVYVGCTKSGSDHWTCRAAVEVYKLYGLTPKIIKANTSLIFDSAASTSWGHVQFMQWDVVLNPANGFIKEDAITIEVTITAQIPEGLQLTPDYYTDERANIAYTNWTQEKYILETKLQNLKSLNEVNNNKIIALTQTIEDLKKQLQRYNNLVQELDDCKKNLETAQAELEVKNKECEANLHTEKENVNRLNKEATDFKAEIENLQKKIISVTKQLEENCKNSAESNDSNKLCDAKLKTSEAENSNLKKNLSSIQSKLDESNMRLQNLITNHSNQIETIEVERDSLKTNLEAISKELDLLKTSSSEESNLAKKDKENLDKTIQNLKDQIQHLNTVNNDLKTENDKLDVQVTNLQLNLNKTTEALKQNEIDKLKTENQNLIAQMKIGYEKYNKLKSAKDTVDSQLKLMIGNSSEAKEELDKIQKNITATQRDLSDCKETLQKIKTENNTLSAKLLSSNTELEDIKNKLANSENNSNEMKDLKDYCEKLKLEITSLINSLTESKNEIQRMKNKFQKRTTYDENTSLEIDLINGGMSKQENDIKNSKLSNDVDSEKLAELDGKYKIATDARNKLKCEIESLRKKFEKINKDAYESFQEENKNITNKLKDLQIKLDEERKEKLQILDRKKEVDDELNELKQENEAQTITKNTLLEQVRQCHQLSKEVFWLIIELVKIKKSQEEIPCSIESRLRNIMEILSKNKRRAYLRSTSADTILNQPPSTQISTDIIQKKLDDLESRLEKEVEIVSSELKTEQNKRRKLMLCNMKLSVLLENEIFMTEQYKKLASISESKSEDIQNRLNDSKNQFFVERNRRFHYEEDIHRLSNKIENIEIQTYRMKNKIRMQALEVCEECSCSYVEDFASNLKQTNALATSDSTDVKANIAGCSSETPTTEHPVHNASTTPNSNKATIEKSEDKNDELVEKIQGARITESDPISLANTNQ